MNEDFSQDRDFDYLEGEVSRLADVIMTAIDMLDGNDEGVMSFQTRSNELIRKLTEHLDVYWDQENQIKEQKHHLLSLQKERDALVEELGEIKQSWKLITD